MAQFITALKKPAESLQSVEKPDPAKKVPHFFSDVRLVETKMVDDQNFKRTFVLFKIQVKVNYAI